MRSRAVGAAAAVALAALYGSSYVATAFQLRGFTPIAGGFWRAVIASGFLAMLASRTAAGHGAGGRARGAGRPEPGGDEAGGDVTGRPPDRRVFGRLAVLALFGGPIFIIGMNVAVANVGATITAFVAGLYAILAALFAPAVVGERLGRATLIGFVIAVAGTALLAGLAPSSETLAGLIAAGIAAVSFGLYIVLLRRWAGIPGMSPVLVSTAVAFGSAAGLAVLLIALDPAGLLPSRTGPDVLLSTAWLVMVTVVGPLLGAIALRRIETRVASTLLLLNPVTATLLGVVLLSERLSPPQMAGAVAVLAGMAIAGAGNRAPQSAVPANVPARDARGAST